MQDVISGGAPASATVVVVAAADPLWSDVRGFWIPLATAIGTVGAVIVSLLLAGRAGRREREAVTRAGAIELLDALAEVHRVLPNIRAGAHPMLDDLGEEADAARDSVQHLLLSVTPLMSLEVQKRWGDLKLLLADFAGARVEVPQGSAPPGPSYWTEAKVNRAMLDAENYLNYVRDSITAVVDGRRLPPAKERPYLRRDDVENVWEPPVRRPWWRRLRWWKK
jgi:hypothetical protein